MEWCQHTLKESLLPLCPVLVRVVPLGTPRAKVGHRELWWTLMTPSHSAGFIGTCCPPQKLGISSSGGVARKRTAFTPCRGRVGTVVRLSPNRLVTRRGVAQCIFLQLKLL